MWHRLHLGSTAGSARSHLATAIAGVALVLAITVALVVPGWRQAPVAHAARAKITSLTLQYKDFGLGSPASITLQNDRGKAHFAPGGDSDHGPISVAADGTFTILIDSGKDNIGNNTELDVAGVGVIDVHTSCSKPIAVGFIYGPDGDKTAEDPSEFGAGGFSAGLEVVGGLLSGGDLDGDCQGLAVTPTPTETATPTDPPPTDTPTPTDTPSRPTNTPEEPKNIIAGCVLKPDLPQIVPTQCKLAHGTQVTVIGIANFGQDFDKDGFAGFHEISISATWSDELNPLDQVRFECPPSPDGGTSLIWRGRSLPR